MQTNFLQFLQYKEDYLDGFANKVTNYAAANPEEKPAGNILNTRAAGFGIVRINTKNRTITLPWHSLE